MSNKKIFIIIFLIAFSMRLAALFSFAEEKSLLYINDSLTYLQTAKNITYHGVYSMEISPTPHPDNFRTPLYPIFLIPFVWLKTSLYVPAVVQNIIMSFGMVLIFWLGQKIFSRRTAIIAVTLSALEPFGALISAQIMTEAIFVALFASAIFLMAIYIKDGHPLQLYLASILLAVSALTRPIAIPIIVLLPLSAYLNKRLTQQSFPWKKIFLALIFFLTVLAPWLWFNWTKLHTLKFSSVNDMQLYAYHGRLFDAWRAERDAPTTDRLPEMDLSPINDTFNAAAIPQFKTIGLSYIKNHLPQYIAFHLLRAPRLFTDSGYASILNGLSFLRFYYDTSAGGFLDQLDWKNLAVAIFTIKKQPLIILLGLADTIFILITILAAANPLLYNKLNKKWPLDRVFLVMVIIAYALISSPIGGARLRIPINPALFFLSVDTIYLIKKLVSKKVLVPTANSSPKPPSQTFQSANLMATIDIQSP